MWLATLSFLVEHGRWVWPVGLALCMYWALRRSFSAANRLLSRHARAEVRAMPEPTTVAGLGGKVGAATLLGTLRCDGACGRFEDGKPVAVAAATPVGRPRSNLGVTARAKVLALVAGKDRVRLAGDVSLLVGTEERWVGRRRPRAAVRERIEAARRAEAESAPRRPLEDLLRQPLVLRSIESGARVVVRGVPTREEDEWVMRPDDGGEPPRIAIMSVEPPRVRLPLSMRPLLRGVIAGALAFGVIFVLPAELAFRATGHESRPDADAVFHTSMEAVGPLQRGLTALALTAPHRREVALRGFANQLHGQSEYDEALLDELATAHSLDGRPELLLNRLFDLGSIRRVADTSAQNDADDVAGFAWLALGRLGRASDALDSARGATPLSRLRRHAVAHLLANHPDRAREAMSRVVDEGSGMQSVVAECLELALGAREDPEALSNLSDVEQRGGSACRLLHADLLVDDARRTYLDEHGDELFGPEASADSCTTATLLALEVDEDHEVPECARPFEPFASTPADPSDIVVAQREGLVSARAGLEVAALRATRERRARDAFGRRLRVELAVRAAILDAWTGQSRRAHRWLAEAQRIDVDVDDPPFLDPGRVDAALRVRGGNAPPDGLPDDVTERLRTLHALLSGGDALAIAQALYVAPPVADRPVDRPLVAQIDREHPERWLRGSSLAACDGWGAPGGPHDSFSRCDPATLVADAANRALVARAVGERAIADDLEQLTAAFGRALRTRRYAVAMAILTDDGTWGD